MELRKINTKNIDDILDLTVNKDQKGFVASNEESLAEAYATINTDGMEAFPFRNI